MKKKSSYEEKVKLLENIVGEMESNELPLEEAIKKYEDGVKLCNELFKTLNEAEGKIKILTELGEEDFEVEGERNDI